MAVGSNNAIFPSRPHPARVQIITANTGRDGSGTVGLLITAGADGSRVFTVRAIATGNNSAGMIRIFVGNTGTAASYRLIDEIEVAANTVSATLPAWTGVWNLTSLQLNVDLLAGESMYVSTEIGEQFNVYADAADY